MSNKDDRIYLILILEYIADIERYVGADKTRFMTDDLVRNATLRQLQVMAESTQRLSSSIKQLRPDFPWLEVADFRNVLVHNYDGRIDLELVWSSIEQDVPELKQTILQLMEKHDDRD